MNNDLIKKILIKLLEYDVELPFEVHGNYIYIHECFDSKILSDIAHKYRAFFDGSKIVINTEFIKEGDLNE